jgi:SAM-dependent methyltransferase
MPGHTDAYDALAYPDLSYSCTHPSRLAALASAHGRPTGDPRTARVLEIGCATGANLLPMAYGLPEATFVGIDLSGAQIDVARRAATSLGLANVELHTLDLRHADALGTFDYVVAHGVHSWVPPDVAHALVTLLGRIVRPGGLAYVSVNTFPGWHPLLGVRDLMQFATRGIDDPAARAAAAREIVHFVAGAVPDPDHDIQAATLRSYLEGRATSALASEAWADSVLLHDELEEHNHPVLVGELIAEAAQHGLAYLAEAELADGVPRHLAPEVLAELERRASSRADFEQLVDFVVHRVFRKAVFVRSDEPVAARLRAEGLLDLHVTTLGAAGPDGEVLVPDGTVFRTGHAPTREAFAALMAAAPVPVAFRALAERLEEAPVVAGNLLRAHLHSSALVDLLRSPPSVSLESAPPLGFTPARCFGGRLVTNVLHRRVELEAADRAVLDAADGTRDVSAIAALTGLDESEVDDRLAALRYEGLLE